MPPSDVTTPPRPRRWCALVGGWSTSLALLLGGCGAAPPPGPRPAAPPEVQASCRGATVGVALGPPLGLLGDHLVVRGPAGTRRVASRGGAAAEASESQVIIPGAPEDGADGGAPALRLVVTELYRSTPADVQGAVRAWLGSAVEGVERLPTVSQGGAGEGVEVFFAVPALSPADGTSLVARAVVASPDGTVQHAAFFLPGDPPGRADQDDVAPCAALARQIAGTFTAGPRRLDTTGGPQVLVPGVAIDLPAGYAALHRPGPDFEVYYFYRLVPLGGPHAQLGVYLGFEPRTHVGDVLEMRSIPGAMLGQSVEWTAWTTAVEGRRVAHMEAIMPVPGGDGTYAHAFFVSEDPDLADELKAVAETLSLFSPTAE